MSRPRLRVEPLMLLGRHGRRVTVSCQAHTCSLGIAPPVPDYLPEALRYLKASVLYRHESDCGRCDLKPVWRAHGLTELKAAVDTAWDAAVADKLRELAN